MVFKCQEDSYLQEVSLLCHYRYPPVCHHCFEIVNTTSSLILTHLNLAITDDKNFFLIKQWIFQYTTTVVHCEPTEFSTKINNEDASVKGYEVILENTIIFPEGGGQVIKHIFTQRTTKSNYNRSIIALRSWIFEWKARTQRDP